MRSLTEIRAELERATERRAQLWEELGAGFDAQKSAEAARLSERINELWAEARSVRARSRFGPSELILRRARAEERAERETRRRLDRAA